MPSLILPVRMALPSTWPFRHSAMWCAGICGATTLLLQVRITYQLYFSSSTYPVALHTGVLVFIEPRREPLISLSIPIGMIPIQFFNENCRTHLVYPHPKNRRLPLTGSTTFLWVTWWETCTSFHTFLFLDPFSRLSLSPSSFGLLCSRDSSLWVILLVTTTLIHLIILYWY